MRSSISSKLSFTSVVSHFDRTKESDTYVYTMQERNKYNLARDALQHRVESAGAYKPGRLNNAKFVAEWDANNPVFESLLCRESQGLSSQQGRVLSYYPSRHHSITCSTNSSKWPVSMSFSIKGASTLPLSNSRPAPAAAFNGTIVPASAPTHRPAIPAVEVEVGGNFRSCGRGTLQRLHTRTICSWAAEPHSFPSSTHTSTSRINVHK